MKNNKNNVWLTLCIIPIAIVSKIYQYAATSGSSFSIMNYMLNWLNSGYIPTDNSYAFPLKIYSCFKFLGFKTNLEWSIFWTVIFNIIFLCILIIPKKRKISEWIFIYSSLFIVDFSVLNLNKDLIQLAVILIIYGILQNMKIKNNMKVLLISIIFLIEAIYFRAYYILIAGSIWVVYFVLNKTLKEGKEKEVKSWIKAIIIILIIMFIGIYFTRYIMPEAYQQLINRRERLEYGVQANTLILDKFENTSYVGFMANYIVTAIRMCFPIELLAKNIKYVFFVVYQLYLTYSIFRAIKYVKKEQVVTISFIVAYWLTFFASESDFGTLVRHQSILLFIYLTIIEENNKYKMMKKARKKENTMENQIKLLQQNNFKNNNYFEKKWEGV